MATRSPLGCWLERPSWTTRNSGIFSSSVTVNRISDSTAVGSTSLTANVPSCAVPTCCRVGRQRTRIAHHCRGHADGHGRGLAYRKLSWTHGGTWVSRRGQAAGTDTDKMYCAERAAAQPAQPRPPSKLHSTNQASCPRTLGDCCCGIVGGYGVGADDPPAAFGGGAASAS